jgi:cAMP-dependent protein kinase regulator
VSRHVKNAARDYENRGFGSKSRSPEKKKSKPVESTSNKQPAAASKNKKADSSEEESDDREDSEMSSKLAKRKEKGKEVKRAGVSAESYGKYNKKAEFKPVVIPKDKEQKKRILEKINQNIFLKSLSDEDKEIIIDAMKELKKKKGDIVIRQGDPGDEFFVVDEGEIECHRVFKQGEAAKYLKTYLAGEGFGELALLYNAPRAATLTCKTPCTLLVLDRQTFNHVIRESTFKKRQRYEEVINKIELLNGMEKYEK